MLPELFIFFTFYPLDDVYLMHLFKLIIFLN